MKLCFICGDKIASDEESISIPGDTKIWGHVSCLTKRED